MIENIFGFILYAYHVILEKLKSKLTDEQKEEEKMIELGGHYLYSSIDSFNFSDISHMKYEVAQAFRKGYIPMKSPDEFLATCPENINGRNSMKKFRTFVFDVKNRK